MCLGHTSVSPSCQGDSLSWCVMDDNLPFFLSSIRSWILRHWCGGLRSALNCHHSCPPHLPRHNTPEPPQGRPAQYHWCCRCDGLKRKLNRHSMCVLYAEQRWLVFCFFVQSELELMRSAFISQSWGVARDGASPESIAPLGDYPDRWFLMMVMESSITLRRGVPGEGGHVCWQRHTACPQP